MYVLTAVQFTNTICNGGPPDRRCHPELDIVAGTNPEDESEAEPQGEAVLVDTKTFNGWRCSFAKDRSGEDARMATYLARGAQEMPAVASTPEPCRHRSAARVAEQTIMSQKKQLTRRKAADGVRKDLRRLLDPAELPEPAKPAEAAIAGIAGDVEIMGIYQVGGSTGSGGS